VRVFLDTNVLVSAAATRGLCADVLREVLASHELLTSAQVLSELKRVLRTKLGVAGDLIDEFLSLIRQDTVLAQPGPPVPVEISDFDDVRVLSAAIAGRAEVFVTGDKELLNLRRVGGLAILSPRQFWDKLKAQPKRPAGRRERRRSR
jgi:putative PIN family toxin of toxin-antitoxin system